MLLRGMGQADDSRDLPWFAATRIVADLLQHGPMVHHVSDDGPIVETK
jgi:hypothetical protein